MKFINYVTVSDSRFVIEIRPAGVLPSSDTVSAAELINSLLNLFYLTVMVSGFRSVCVNDSQTCVCVCVSDVGFGSRLFRSNDSLHQTEDSVRQTHL